MAAAAAKASAKTAAKKSKKGSKKVSKKVSRPRLWARAVFSGYRRSKVHQNCNSALLHIQGVHDRDAADWYSGKRCAYVYRATGGNSEVRTIWGKVTCPHGSAGVVRARFRHNLPPHAMGKRVRVMLYPSKI